MLRATTLCAFSTSQLLKVLRSWGVLYILTWTCASRHDSVQFFISHLALWLRTRRFCEVTFRPSRATNHWKNTVNRDLPTFSRTCIFFLLTFSPLWSSHFFSAPLWLFTPLLFHLSILSEVWLLNFLRWLTYYYKHLQTSTVHAVNEEGMRQKIEPHIPATVNFVNQVRVPGWNSWGLLHAKSGDMRCPHKGSIWFNGGSGAFQPRNRVIKLRLWYLQVIQRPLQSSISLFASL